MGKNYFEDFEYLLPTHSFYRNSDIIQEYGSNYETFILNSVLLKDEELFYKYQNENLITITTQSGVKSVSRHLLLDLLTNEGLYKYVITNLDNELSVGARLDLFVDGSIKGSIQIGRADLSLFLKQLNTQELTPQQRMRIALITNITSLFSLEQKYNEAFHTTSIDGNIITISASELIGILTMPDEEFYDFVYGANPFDYSKAEMVYMLINFININRILEKYLFPPKVLERYKALESQALIDYEALNKNLKANDNDIDGESIIDKMHIDKLLEEEIFRYKKNTYGPLETAIYIYIRLCELLTYDQSYFANNNDPSEEEKHNNIENIANINLENNAVTNYEFLLLYTYLLKRLGIKYTLDNRLLSGSSEGCSITFRCGEFLVQANAVQNIIDSDMTNAKINAPLTGLSCLNKSDISHQKFEEIFFKVVQNINETKINQVTFAANLKKYHEEYAKNDLPFKDKLYVLLKNIARPDLKGIDAIGYQKKIFDNLFKSDDEIKISFISSTINPYRGATFTPLTIISVFKDGGFYYYMIDPNNSDIVISVSKEEIEDLFESRDFAFIGSEDSILGLEKKEGVNYVR